MTVRKNRFCFPTPLVIASLTAGLWFTGACNNLPLTGTTVAGNASISPPAASSSSAVQQLLDLTNAQRTIAGLNPVTLSDQLNQAAQVHTQDMVTNNYFGHTGSDGSDPGQRISATGYQWQAYGENIASGFATPQDVLTAWMNSPEHRANILNPIYTQMGAAVIGQTWTQEFATPK